MQITSNHGSPVQEDSEDTSNTLDSSSENYNSLPGVPHELEIHAVSVVPDDTFTIRQAINTFGFGKFQAKLSLFTGLCWMSDSMEITILSILSPALHCDWNITRYQQAFATMVVFLGMMISSPFWEYVSDRFGRKKPLTLCALLLLYYGLLSSLAPTFTWILILRGLVGFAIGCVPQSVTLYAEYLPLKQRAKCVVLLDCFWALGACFEVVLALLVMPTLGWQWLLALSTAPVFAFACVCPWLPESVKFCVASGNSGKALELLRTVANENNKSMLLGRLVIDDSTVEDNGKTRDLISPQTRSVSLLVWTIWATCSFCYYGIVLMSTELVVSSNKTYFIMKEGLDVCSAQCSRLNTQDYMDLLWTTFAEFPGILLTIFIIEKFGHKKTMALQFFMFVVCTILLYFYIEKRLVLVTLLFLARGIIAGVFQAAYLYTPEVYPSGLRSVGLSTCSLVARFGAMMTPYVAQVLLHSSLLFALGVYGTSAIIAATACTCLPVGLSTNKPVKKTNIISDD